MSESLRPTKSVSLLRRMNRSLRQAYRAKRVGILDIGSSKICCAIIEVPHAFEADSICQVEALDPNDFNVIGVAQIQSKGVDRGDIHAPHIVQRLIRDCLMRMEADAGVCIDHVVVSLADAMPHSVTTTVSVNVDTGEISESDLLRAASNLKLPRMPEHPARQVLHAMPVHYTLDGGASVRDPRTRSATILDVDFHTLTVDTKPVEDVIKCVEKCDLSVCGLVSSGYASALACLNATEMEHGSVCIDVGESKTSLAMMLNGDMVFAHTIHMAGRHVTQDISQGLNIDLLTAERLKTFYGGVVATEVDKFDVISLSRERAQKNDMGHRSVGMTTYGDQAVEEKPHSRDFERTIPRSHLISIMRPRIEETLEIANDALEKAGFSSLPKPQIVFTGGSCQIPGFLEVAQKVFGYRIRIGRPLKLQGLPSHFTTPAFSTLVGLAHYVTSSSQKTSETILSYSSHQNKGLNRITHWFKENW